MRKSDSGIASGSFNDGTTGLEEALFFGVLDDEERSAVLHTTSGVLELRLAENIAAGLLGELLQANERGVANCCRKQIRLDWIMMSLWQ